MAVQRSYAFSDRTVSASFTHHEAVVPEEVVRELRAVLAAVGGAVLDVLPYEEASAATKVDGDTEYITTDVQVVLPSGRRVWLGVECPTDRAFA